MTNITDRYATAVRSKNLRASAETMADGTNPVATAAAADVIGAFGLAGKKQPLAMALARLLVGDRQVARVIVDLLTEKVLSKADAWSVDIRQDEAVVLGKSVLAWAQFGTCKPCKGLGYPPIPGTTTLSQTACPECHGTGRMPFDPHFAVEHLQLARWLLAEIERDISKAGPVAMAALAPHLEL